MCFYIVWKCNEIHVHVKVIIIEYLGKTYTCCLFTISLFHIMFAYGCHIFLLKFRAHIKSHFLKTKVVCQTVMHSTHRTFKWIRVSKCYLHYLVRQISLRIAVFTVLDSHRRWTTVVVILMQIGHFTTILKKGQTLETAASSNELNVSMTSLLI